MALELSWQLSSSLARPDAGFTQRQDQPGNWIQLALALEYAGLDGLWIDNGIHQPESLAVAAALCAHTQRLVLTVSIAAEVMLPAALATTLQSLQSISRQRIRLYLPDSGRNSAYRAFGEFLNRDQRSERIGEYLELLTRLWAPQAEPFHHSGQYFQLENAGLAKRDLCAPPLILDESQGPELTGRHADQTLVALAPLPVISTQLQRLNEAAKAQGRMQTFACRLGLILGDSEEKAWEAAERYLAGLSILPPPTEPGVSDMSKAFSATKRLQIHPNLWQPTAQGPVFLVGTAEQLAARLETLHQAGIRQVILDAADGVADVLRFAEQVLPLLKSRGLRPQVTEHV